MINSPCYGCPDRYPACHDHCDKYKDFRAELDDYNEACRETIRSTPDRPPVGFRANHGAGYSGWFDVRKVNAMNRKRAWKERNAP